MDVNDIWIIALAISTPVAGVVGFAIQLRNVKKLRLENEKLHMEIQLIEKELQKSERRIIEPTTEEVLKYNDIARFSRASDSERKQKKISLSFGEVLILIGTFLFVLYFLYDIYRLFAWLVDKLISN